MDMWRLHPQKARRAYSLLEVVLASTICTSALVPALALVRDSLDLADRIDKRHLILIYGVSMMEEQLAIVAATWSEGSLSGDYAGDGHANVRYSVTRSDDSINGGIADRLMCVSVTAYNDEDGDDSLDSGEMRTTLTTKISKVASYEQMAGS
jgi:hypothetical protein